MTSPQPQVIHRSDPSRIEIEWDDGARSDFTAAHLRSVCPCAECVDEITGIRRHDPETVDPAIEQSDAELVGHYAISMRFSDGHGTGIFSFRFLREQDPGG